MIIEVKKYNKARNVLECTFPNGSDVIVDPFVGRAIEMTGEEYEKGKGFELEGVLAEIEDGVAVGLPKDGTIELLPWSFSVINSDNKRPSDLGENK